MTAQMSVLILEKELMPTAGEHPEALLLQVSENGAGLLDVVPVRPGAVGVVENGGGANQTAYLVQPALCIRLHPLQRRRTRG